MLHAARWKIQDAKYRQLECGPMPNVMAVPCAKDPSFHFRVPRLKVWLTPAAGVLCSNAVNIFRTQNLDVKWILHVAKFRQGARATENVYIVYQLRNCQTSCKVWLASRERRRCSNEAKTRNPLKFAGVPQTRQSISSVSGPKFAILWGTSGGDIAV